jgi:4'-phosphopantetheinyl transferase
MPSVETTPQLAAGEVHLWKLEPLTGLQPSSWLSLLDAEEQARASRFRFPHLTHSFVADHARQRLLLGHYTQTAPAAIRYQQNNYGKPSFASPETNVVTPVHFNLSHTEGMTLLAVCLDHELGVDVEALRPMDDWEEIAATHFSAAENAELRSFDAADRSHAFFRCWTRKEAFLKASGEGLSKPLDAFSISIARTSDPSFLACEWNPEETKRWILKSLSLGEGFTGALALQHRNGAEPWKIVVFDDSDFRAMFATERV